MDPVFNETCFHQVRKEKHINFVHCSTSGSVNLVFSYIFEYRGRKVECND